MNENSSDFREVQSEEANSGKEDYTEEDKNKLYNELTSRWVKPMHLSRSGEPVYSEMGLTNRFIFESLEELLDVDMDLYNNFRTMMNLNPKVDVSQVELNDPIDDPGSGYAETNMGLCIIGGSSFTYTVNSVDDAGRVTSLSITPDEHVTEIPLWNFDFNVRGSNRTSVYGTSPLNGNGKGLKISFSINYEYFQSILPYKGEYYTDLFALVRENDGLFLYTFDIDTTSGEMPKPGTWTKGMKLSEFEVTSTNKSEGGIATQESFINSIIPKLEGLPVPRKEDHVENVRINVMQTANTISVIDTNYTPVMPVRESDDDDEPIPSNVIDICKFYCDGILKGNAASRSANAVVEAIRRMNLQRYDSYIIWRWERPNSMDTNFLFGIVTRGLNNYFTTDVTTKLPTNQLNCDNYVHFNPSTTVIWNVPGVGPMIWVYDPNTTKKEEYRIDAETMNLEVIRKEMTYADIDIRNTDGYEPIKVVDENGNYLWNIMTNNPQNIPYTPSADEPLYQNPPMTNMGDIIIGTNVNLTPENHKMKGNWKLVFPRINTFKLSNDITNTVFNPKRMETIKGKNLNITDTSRVYDTDGNDVSSKTLIIDDNENGLQMSVYNSATSRWENI